jgi:energy-coupling factor transporter ATP-binding protein EcfA2
MPPLKRFRDMEHLSGGEKTMAALALLFSVHSYQPSPFFVLDEVDAALDNANVAKLVGYIRRNAGPGMQFIVISLKPGFFEGSETLVGVMRDQAINSSKTLTLDVRVLAGDVRSLMLSSCGNTRPPDCHDRWTKLHDVDVVIERTVHCIPCTINMNSSLVQPLIQEMHTL